MRFGGAGSELVLRLLAALRTLCRDLSGRGGWRAVGGFVVAYRPPTRPEALFVWQIGVASWARRRGMGLKLLEELRRQPACCDARFLEATVAPHNAASQRLFAAAASAWRAPLQIEPGFHAADFGAAAHSDEPLTRIGPLF